jgi:predicted ATPase
VRTVLAKADQPLWSVAIRYAVAAAATTSKHGEKVLRGRAHALAAAFALYSGRNRLARRHLARPGQTLEARTFRGGDLLSTAELAALAHLPLDRVVPSLARAGARPVAPPPGVGRDEHEGKVLGVSDAGGARPVVLRPADARHHLHVMGATGSGKSTLLTHLILGDIAAGRGAVVIDPKGDLVTDVLARLGPTARKKLVLLDPLAPEGRPKLNMLEITNGVGPELVVDHLVGIFGRVFERHWGPRLEDVLRSTCLTLLQQPGVATLAAVPRLLDEPALHAKYLTKASPEELRGFWKWYEAIGEGQRAQVVGPLLYKLRAFLLRPAVREIVDARVSTLNVGEQLDGRLLLVRVPKGLLGEDTARLLGSFVVAKVWQAATGRAGLGQDARVDASLYVDECQNFLTLPRSFDEILAEARGYRLSLVLAHQHLGQLPRELRDAVSANARNKVFFTMSPEDAFVLARHTTPQLTEHDLANLDAYQAAVRLVNRGQDTPAFTLRTRPISPQDKVA